MERTQQILIGLLKHARPEILTEFREDSCIVSTRVGLDVLDYFGVLAEPLAVSVTIYNPPTVERVTAGMGLPQTREQMEEWVEKYQAWIIGLGMGGDKGPMKWPGHLVLIAEKTIMLDLSLDQASRPQHGIKLGPFGTTVTQKFLSGHESLVAEVNGCALKYLVLKNNFGYTSSPDWLIRSRRSRIVRSIIGKIEQELKCT